MAKKWTFQCRPEAVDIPRILKEADDEGAVAIKVEVEGKSPDIYVTYQYLSERLNKGDGGNVLHGQLCSAKGEKLDRWVLCARTEDAERYLRDVGRVRTTVEVLV